MIEHSNNGSSILDEAQAIASEGVRVFPCRANDKRPAVNDWPNVSTCDPSTISGWFGGAANLGLRCGQTAGGEDIFVVDIDIKNDQPGEKSWADFCDEHPEVREIAERTVSVTTPSGGWHFYFAVPEGRWCPRNSNPWPGVDIRGEGGYVLAPPSVLPNGSYAWTRDLWAPNEGIMYAPVALMEALNNPQPVADIIPINRGVPISSMLAHPSNIRPGDDNPIDWAKENFSVYDWLLRHGWQAGVRRGSQEEITRPGKSRRDGTSATVHHDSNIVNVHTSTLPVEFMSVGKPTANGGYTINGFDAWMIENGILDRREAMSAIRKQLMPQQRLMPATASTLPTGIEPPEPAAVASSLNLPPEFWEARPWLAHIRQGAWANQVCPDAVLAGILARYSANLHPSIRLQQMGTLDFFAVIAGHSGGYKSKAGKTARELWPGPDSPFVLMDRNVGSGEGLAEAFFEWRDEDDQPCSASKKGAKKVRKKWGLHFATDESTALTQSAARSGSIIIQTMCSAWMGEAIGQILADPTKSRMIEPYGVRVAAELRIQTLHGYKLFAEEYASTGLAQRMLCSYSLDPSIHEREEAGEDLPEWPGQLDLPLPFVVTGTVRTLEYDPTITAHLRKSGAAGHNPAWAGDPLDTHADLVRLKVAGLLTLMDDRMSISISDWDLADHLLQVHRRIRSLLRQTKTQVDQQAHVTRVTAQAEVAVKVDEARDKAMLKRTIEAIRLRSVEGRTLSKNRFSAPQRDYYEDAMRILEAQGLVNEVDGVWKPL